jgi:hypothetical protein
LTWVTTAEAAGTAVGAGAAGVLASDHGSWLPFAAASLLLVLTASAALAARRRS